LPLLAAAPAQAQPLPAGIARADTTPPTGYAFGGWTRADRVGRGVHTRLNATALVLERGDRRVALVRGPVQQRCLQVAVTAGQSVEDRACVLHETDRRQTVADGQDGTSL